MVLSKIKNVFGVGDDEDGENDEVRRMREELEEMKEKQREQQVQEENEDDESICDALKSQFGGETVYQAINNWLMQEDGVDIKELCAKIMVDKLQREGKMPEREFGELEKLSAVSEELDGIEEIMGGSDQTSVEKIKQYDEMVSSAANLKDNVKRLKGESPGMDMKDLIALASMLQDNE